MNLRIWIPVLASLAACSNTQVRESSSHAVYAEFARENLQMKGGLNRRVFNTTEAQAGSDIRLEKDGSITLQPGTYRITGFSLVTMQITMESPVPKNGTNYPGYCLLYPVEFEKENVLKYQIGIGSPATALDTVPSLFDVVVKCDKVTKIAVGHQVGEDTHDEVYLAVYDVAGAKSPYHVFARIAIFKL